MQKSISWDVETLRDWVEELVILFVMTLPKSDDFLPTVTRCALDTHIAYIFTQDYLGTFACKLLYSLRAFIDNIEVDERVNLPVQILRVKTKSYRESVLVDWCKLSLTWLNLD